VSSDDNDLMKVFFPFSPGARFFLRHTSCYLGFGGLACKTVSSGEYLIQGRNHFMINYGKYFYIILIIFCLTICNCGGGGGGEGTGASNGGGTISLAWDAPTTKNDGSPLADTDLAGYRVHYGTSTGNYTESKDVGNVTGYTLTNLVSGQIYFIAVTATGTADSPNESDFSNEVSAVAN
jgi:hypothetical protein